MKSIVCLLSLFFITEYDVWAEQASGLIIYTDHPSTYVESCEFTSLDSTKPAYYTIARIDGQRLQIQPGGLWVVVDYPSSTHGENMTDLAESNLATIQALLAKYPQFKARLLAAQSKWQNALEAVHRMAFKPQANTPKITLNYAGSQYDGVRLTSLDNEQVGITHSDGITKLELGKLTKSQIVSLNTTSSVVQIDLNWAVKKQQKIDEEKQRLALVQNQGDSKNTKTGEMPKNVAGGSKENPFVNSLGMQFVPVAGTHVLFSVWDTRVKDYRAYAESNSSADSKWKNPGFQQSEDYPVVDVSWDDAKAFCAWMTQKERNEGKIAVNDEYRLPTDHQWSCAVGIGDQEDANATPSSKRCRIKGVYPWGKQWPPPKGAGNYDSSIKVDDYEHTSPVGSFRANQYGLYDMGGNVSQWCEDLFDPTQIFRVVRGSSWNSFVPDFLLSSIRIYAPPSFRHAFNGFRCVLVASSVTADTSNESRVMSNGYEGFAAVEAVERGGVMQR